MTNVLFNVIAMESSVKIPFDIVLDLMPVIVMDTSLKFFYGFVMRMANISWHIFVIAAGVARTYTVNSPRWDQGLKGDH